MQEMSDTRGVRHRKDSMKSSQLVHQLVDKQELLQNEDVRQMLSKNNHLLHDALKRLDSDYRRFILTSISHYEFLAEHAEKERYEEEAAKYRLLKELFQIILKRSWTADDGENNNGK